MNRNRIRKAQAKKLTAAALAVLMSTQLCAAPITAQAAGSADSDKDKDNTESQKEESKAVGKDETVYVKTDASGNTKDITVSDWLKNTDGTSSIQDASDLTDITNVKGDETYAQEDNGNMLWTSDGSDIYYQGKSNGQLPVDVKITYYLDGQEIAPENLAGKSGKVKIRFDYTNNSKKTVKVNGKEEEIYTPFLMASAMILPGDNFKNVEVSNGKVISDGSNNIVVGIALPGLEDSLKLDELDLGDRDEIPDYVEVTADVTDFKLEMTATVASCGNLDDLGFSDVDSLDDLKDALDELADASQKLVDGSGDLLDGVKEVRLFGEDIAVNAEIAVLHGTSGHADQKGLLNWVEAFEKKPETIFVNHGDTEACEAFQALLQEKGYVAVAPFSGAEFDLVSGKFLAFPEGCPIAKRGAARKKGVFDALIAAAQRLLLVAQSCKERPNRDLTRFTAQIQALIDRWEK